MTHADAVRPAYHPQTPIACTIISTGGNTARLLILDEELVMPLQIIRRLKHTARVNCPPCKRERVSSDEGIAKLTTDMPFTPRPSPAPVPPPTSSATPSRGRTLPQEILDQITVFALESSFDTKRVDVLDHTHRLTTVALAATSTKIRAQVLKTILKQREEVQRMEVRAYKDVLAQCEACNHRKRESAKACGLCNEKVLFWKKISAFEFSMWRTVGIVKGMELSRLRQGCYDACKNREIEVKSRKAVEAGSKDSSEHLRALPEKSNEVVELITLLNLKVPRYESDDGSVLTNIDGEEVWIRSSR